jgi:hypothetical protein
VQEGLARSAYREFAPGAADDTQLVVSRMIPFCCSSKTSSNPMARYEYHEPEGQNLLPIQPEPRKEEQPPSSCCARCLKACCGCTLVLAVLLVILALRVWTAECAIQSFDHHYILPKNADEAGVKEPFDRGTADNMDLEDLDIDLAGVWWMDGNPLTAEHLVSFASAEGKKPFPAMVPVFNNLKGRWTWTDDISGRFVMAYYAFDSDPLSSLDFNFTNSSYARINPVGAVFGDGYFGFKKINKDEWDRPDANYILRRIVNADGSEGQFWDKFIKWYDGIQPEGKVLIWSSDSGCQRKCQYFMPCFACDFIC